MIGCNWDIEGFFRRQGPVPRARFPDELGVDEGLPPFDEIS